MPTTSERAVLPERLRRLRARAGMSQQALANVCGLSWSIIACIEQGKSADPKLSTLRKLAEALEVSLDELAGR